LTQSLGRFCSSIWGSHSARWLDWIALLLSTASTNNRPGRRICHARGLRLGDPLSLLLFVPAVEALNAIYRRADAEGLFLSLRAPSIRYQLSPYADDLVVFVAPYESDFALVKAIMDSFAQISGLHTNVSKCQITPVRCSDEQIAAVQKWYPAQLVQFSCHYLGVSLAVYVLKKGDLLPLVDAVADRLPLWKANLLKGGPRSPRSHSQPSPYTSPSCWKCRLGFVKPSTEFVDLSSGPYRHGLHTRHRPPGRG
jgi:hypothetical protein